MTKKWFEIVTVEIKDGNPIDEWERYAGFDEAAAREALEDAQAGVEREMAARSEGLSKRQWQEAEGRVYEIADDADVNDDDVWQDMHDGGYDLL